MGLSSFRFAVQLWFAALQASLSLRPVSRRLTGLTSFAFRSAQPFAGITLPGFFSSGPAFYPAARRSYKKRRLAA
ncbi:MAG: hypothetical protein N2747_01595 [Chitinophagaceae bacterium]|nr:hypothetical protein [Chitinophagaceae bacterium]